MRFIAILATKINVTTHGKKPQFLVQSGSR